MAEKLATKKEFDALNKKMDDIIVMLEKIIVHKEEARLPTPVKPSIKEATDKYQYKEPMPTQSFNFSRSNPNHPILCSLCGKRLKDEDRDGNLFFCPSCRTSVRGVFREPVGDGTFKDIKV